MSHSGKFIQKTQRWQKQNATDTKAQFGQKARR